MINYFYYYFTVLLAMIYSKYNNINDYSKIWRSLDSLCGHILFFLTTSSYMKYDVHEAWQNHILRARFNQARNKLSRKNVLQI